MAKTQKNSSEATRQRFAELMLKRPIEDLKLIAAAYDRAYDLVQLGKNPDEAFYRELARAFSGVNSQRKYQIMGRPLSYKQGRIVFDIVRNGYGSRSNEASVSLDDVDFSSQPNSLENLAEDEIVEGYQKHYDRMLKECDK